MSVTLYVSNLPLSATEATLASRFGSFGGVVSVTLETPKRHDARGAFVEMQESADAQRAIGALNPSELDGRLMCVYLALGSVCAEGLMSSPRVASPKEAF